MIFCAPFSIVPHTLMAQPSKEPFLIYPQRIGTRGSPLALAQARQTQRLLMQATGSESEYDGSDAEQVFPLQMIQTTGDQITDRALSESGGKGLFTKEIDAAQLAGDIAISVHSAKDLPTHLPNGLVIAGYLPREDARDALISQGDVPFGELPLKAVIGTASLRRQAMLLRLRPDLHITLLRGNVGTRLKKVSTGDVHATLLAVAGLNRLELSHVITEKLALDSFIPAVGQGAIALVRRQNDDITAELLSRITCADTAYALDAERAFLTMLDGSCRTPLAGHAVVTGSTLTFTGMVLSCDGQHAFEVNMQGHVNDASRLGREAGTDIKHRAKPFLDWL
jgi:hydroxymethylbilane synthase